MNPFNQGPTPTPTPAPLHDIVGPVWYWPYPLWMTIAGAAVLAVLLFLLFQLVKKLLARKAPPLTNRQKALEALEKLRAGVSGADPYKFGVNVSNALRRYIQAEYGLEASTQTSIEFLDTLRESPFFTDHEKDGLEVFLSKTDLLKYARSGAPETELLDLLDISARHVRGEAQSPGKEPAK
jgi:hypothetical protein